MFQVTFEEKFGFLLNSSSTWTDNETGFVIIMVTMSAALFIIGAIGTWGRYYIKGSSK